MAEVCPKCGSLQGLKQRKGFLQCSECGEKIHPARPASPADQLNAYFQPLYDELVNHTRLLGSINTGICVLVILFVAAALVQIGSCLIMEVPP